MQWVLWYNAVMLYLGSCILWRWTSRSVMTPYCNTNCSTLSRTSYRRWVHGVYIRNTLSLLIILTMVLLSWEGFIEYNYRHLQKWHKTKWFYNKHPPISDVILESSESNKQFWSLRSLNSYPRAWLFWLLSVFLSVWPRIFFHLHYIICIHK